MKMLGKLARSPAARYVCQNCEKLMVYSRGRLVYVADLGQIMLAKLTPGREEKP